MWIFILLAVVDLYIWCRLVTDLRKRNMALQVISFAVKAVISVILFYLIIRILIYKGEFADPANTFRYIAFGVINVIIISVGSLYLVMSITTRLLGRILSRKLGGMVVTNVIISGVIIILFADGYFRQRFDLRVTREEISVRNLDARLDGMKIVLISDLHLSSYQGHYERLAEVIDSVNAEKADLLINTGDFITFGWQEFGECDTILKRAVAGCGSFAVAGNHDDGTYYPDYDEGYGSECVEKTSEKIASSGYTLLEDTTLLIQFNGAPVALSGVVTHGHRLNMSYGNFEKVLAQADDSVFSLLLVHDPAGWDVAGKRGKLPEITLSGHTHGMQIGLPVPGGYISPASAFHKNWKGLYKNENSYLYVTSGLGTMGMALRIFMPPEIVVITLRKD
jgi:predicted MPP superfamily phosphohydrolase